ncbi:solute carrier family 20 (sodium-dependent phosphate transporter) [Entomortierella parvispora]|uniref:Phosphate transporter n=1 Tax=Entomortierella parvispora TaxID=205924 RepID=A0A9P3H9E2_9FUNG|nr:solute carrier family 20 (sodium-dependent phosphate transporter) [Entomortierella parvispora]
MMNVGDYTFLFALGMIFAFMDSFGIGANDVSNSFGAAVGSGALNLKQAVLIASVCEFLGAFLMGSSTADTIKGGLIDVKLFGDKPELLMLAMVCALVGSSSWVLFASSRGLPVSTTHSIVGAITGAGIAGFGFSAVKWAEVGKIVLSWIISPLAAGLVTAIIFTITRFFILKHKDSLKRGLTAIPFYFAITIFINVFYIIFKGSPGLSLSSLPLGAIIGISLGISVVVFLWCNFFLKVYLRRKLEGEEPLKWYHSFYVRAVSTRSKDAENLEEIACEKDGKMIDSGIENADGSVNSGLAALDDTPDKPSTILQKFKNLLQKLKNKAFAGLNQDITKSSEAVDNIHDNSTRYDSKTEQLFCTLQVLTACFASFAHGSNDVANAIGPLTTIYYVWKHAEVDISGSAPVPVWILAYGGIAIDIGLLTYGYKVMATLGNNICYVSPSRGFSLSLGTSLTVLTCSKLGLPVSTTHCITGATTSVGLCSGGGVKSINWKILGMIASSWIFTLPAAGTVSGLLFALIIYSPHK